MWPFRRREEPDPLLEGVKRGVLATIAQHELQLNAIKGCLTQLEANIAEAAARDRRLVSCETELRAVAKYVEDQINRIDAAVIHVRGLATGHTRKSKGDAQTIAVGERFLAAVATPEGRRGLIAELEGLGDQSAQNGHPDPVGM